MASSSPARRSDSSGAVAHRDDAAVVVNGVSSDDEPSVEWGWHGHYPKVAHFAGFDFGALLRNIFLAIFRPGERGYGAPLREFRALAHRHQAGGRGVQGIHHQQLGDDRPRG